MDFLILKWTYIYYGLQKFHSDETDFPLPMKNNFNSLFIL